MFTGIFGTTGPAVTGSRFFRLGLPAVMAAGTELAFSRQSQQSEDSDESQKNYQIFVSNIFQEKNLLQFRLFIPHNILFND